MNKGKQSGYREVSNTADWALEVWAPDLVTLCVEAARGMFGLMGVEIQTLSHESRDIQIEASDSEGRLVLFLSELLFFLEQDKLAFDEIHIRIKKDRMNAHLVGGKISAQSKEIKAVTYHNLKIREENGLLRTTVVFDV